MDVLSVYTEREQKLIDAHNVYLARLLCIHRLRQPPYSMSLRGIGEAIGLSHERVRQLLREPVD